MNLAKVKSCSRPVSGYAMAAKRGASRSSIFFRRRWSLNQLQCIVSRAPNMIRWVKRISRTLELWRVMNDPLIKHHVWGGGYLEIRKDLTYWSTHNVKSPRMSSRSGCIRSGQSGQRDWTLGMTISDPAKPSKSARSGFCAECTLADIAKILCRISWSLEWNKCIQRALGS